MPYLKNLGGFQQSVSSAFDQLLAPGASAPVSGIYRCKTCGFEMVATLGTPLPGSERCTDHGSRWNTVGGKVVWHVVAVVINASE